MSKRSQRVFRREFKKSGVNGEFSGELVVISGLLRRKEGYKDMNHKGAVTTYETQEYHSAQAFIGGNLVREVEFLSSDRHAGYAAVSDMIGFLGDAILSLCNDAVRKTIDADLPEMGFSEIKSNAFSSSELEEGPMVIDYSATVARLQEIDYTGTRIKPSVSASTSQQKSEEPIVARVSDEDFKKALDAEFLRGKEAGFNGGQAIGEARLDAYKKSLHSEQKGEGVHANLNRSEIQKEALSWIKDVYGIGFGAQPDMFHFSESACLSKMSDAFVAGYGYGLIKGEDIGRDNALKSVPRITIEECLDPDYEIENGTLEYSMWYQVQEAIAESRRAGYKEATGLHKPKEQPFKDYFMIADDKPALEYVFDITKSSKVGEFLAPTFFLDQIIPFAFQVVEACRSQGYTDHSRKI